MKYMLFIHQGAAPTPRSDEWESLSEAEQREVYAAYKALNETPGVSPGLQLQPPETATTVRVQDGKTLTFELASRIPAARMGGAIEVRPVMER